MGVGGDAFVGAMNRARGVGGGDYYGAANGAIGGGGGMKGFNIGPGSQVSGFGMTGGSSFRPGPAPAYGGGVGSLLDMQRADNQWARQNNQANWDQGKGLLLGSQSQYFSDPIANATRNRVQQMLADPEALNDRVQSQIRNQQYNQIGAQSAARMRQLAGTMAAGGQADATSLARMQDRLGRQAMFQQSNVGTNLDIQRAQNRNADMYNAIGAGGRQAGQDYGVNSGTANSFLSHMPQYQADDFSGYAALFGGQGGGGYGAGSYGAGGVGSLLPNFGYNNAKNRDNGNGVGFTFANQQEIRRPGVLGTQGVGYGVPPVIPNSTRYGYYGNEGARDVSPGGGTINGQFIAPQQKKTAGIYVPRDFQLS